jgi:glutamate-1-semialdehyde aminotransferase
VCAKCLATNEQQTNTTTTTTINQYEAGFMGLAHTEEDVEKTIAAAKEVFAII